jgi:hypothetical protein
MKYNINCVLRIIAIICCAISGVSILISHYVPWLVDGINYLLFAALFIMFKPVKDGEH